MIGRSGIKTSCQVLVVLETMWGGSGNAPGLFRINPYNRSGARLTLLIGHDDFWVTNACQEYVKNAQLHGKPDPAWLATNLKRLDYKVLLLAGKVAQKTFDGCGYVPKCKILRMMHPAARTWTRVLIEQWKQKLKRAQK